MKHCIAKTACVPSEPSPDKQSLLLNDSKNDSKTLNERLKCCSLSITCMRMLPLQSRCAWMSTAAVMKLDVIAKAITWNKEGSLGCILTFTPDCPQINSVYASSGLLQTLSHLSCHPDSAYLGFGMSAMENYHIKGFHVKVCELLVELCGTTRVSVLYLAISAYVLREHGWSVWYTRLYSYVICLISLK